MQVTVPFAATDAAGMVHFTRLLDWCEEAEHACLRRLGLPIHDATGGWPRVHVQADYQQALQCGETVEVRIIACVPGGSSVRWRFAIERAGLCCARVELVSVRVDAGGRPQALPATWRARLAEAVE